MQYNTDNRTPSLPASRQTLLGKEVKLVKIKSGMRAGSGAELVGGG